MFFKYTCLNSFSHDFFNFLLFFYDLHISNFKTHGCFFVTYFQPVVTRALVQNCWPLVDLLKRHMKDDKRYMYDVVGEEEVAFKMIQTNVSEVVKLLDDIRAKPRYRRKVSKLPIATKSYLF